MATSGTSHNTSLGTKMTNRARLNHALQKLFPEILQELMTIKEPPHKLLGDVNSNNYLSNKRNLNKDEKILIQNVQTNGYDDFDISLIYKLIRNLNILIPAPSQGWGSPTAPTSTEKTPGDDLERIRLRKNHELSHSGNSPLSTYDLDEHFNTFKDIAERLELFLSKPKGEFVKRFDKLRTCFMDEAIAQIYLERSKTQSSDFNQLIIETWRKEDKDFIITNGAELIQRKLENNQVNVIILNGNPRIGKSVTIKHLALFLQDSEGYGIVYCTSPIDIVVNFKQNQYQVFVFDDLLGKYTLNPIDISDWDRYKVHIKTILKNGKTKILASVRSQVFKDDRFLALDYLKYISLDLFEKNMTSFQQKLEIIKQHNPEYYSEIQSLTQIKGDGIEIDFFPLSFSLKYEGNDYPFFLTDPFIAHYSQEWDELMKVDDKTKFSGLFLLVVHNGAITIDKFLAEQTTEEKQTQDAISEICGINIPRSQIIKQLETLEGVFIKKENGKLTPLHDLMFDFLVYYFGTKMQKAFIKYAHSKVISERTQLKPLDADEKNSEYKVIISIDNVTIYFQRTVSDIFAGKVWDALGNSQMIQDPNFRLKAMKHFKALSSEAKTRLVLIRDTSGKDKGPLPLYIASFFNLKVIVQFLLEYTVPSSGNEEPNSPLFAACKRGHAQIVRMFVLMLLYISSFFKLKAIVEFLSEYTVPFPGNKEPYPPLFAACERGHYEIVRMLLLKGASVNENNRIGITPLIAACQNRHKHIVELLIEHSAELEKADQKGWTPLKWACALRYTDIVNLLISKNANIETTCNHGYTPLMWCCIMGKLSLVRLLVESNAAINSANKCGKTPLMAACYFRRKRIVTYLLDNHANINHSDDAGWTPLMEACFDNDNGGWNQFLEQFEERDPWIPLLKLVATLEQKCDDNVGYNQIVEILLDRGADINTIDANGKTALLHACEGRYNRIVHILIERGADVNKKDNDGETPLIEACFGEDEDVVMPLMEAGNTKIKPIINQLLAAGADADAANDDEWNPFSDACEKGKIDIAAKLIKKMRDVNKSNTEGYSPLELALQNGHNAIYELIKDEGLIDDKMGKRLTKETNCIEPRQEDNMEDELIEACKNGNLTKVESLIDNCADVNCHNDRERTPLLEACKGNFIEIFDLLLDAGASVKDDDDRCRTPLYEACKADSYSIVNKILALSLRLDVNASDDRGFSPILIACQNGHLSISKLLLDRKADVDIANNAGITPLIAACSKGDTKMVRMLLSKQADVNKSDAYGDTPLMVASYYGHIEIVKMLCSKSADMHKKDCKGYFCVFWGWKGRNRNLLQFLLKRQQ